MVEETTPETDMPETESAAEAAPLSEAEQIVALEAEVADLKDRILRTLAEMENLRRRGEREMADTRQYSVASFARDMLNVGDNLRRAIEAVPEKPKDDADPALAALIEGVEVTERGLVQTLEKFGVQSIEAMGQKFDPTRHQAMFEIDAPDLPAGTVAEVVQTGYIIGERVLRPAFVGVAKGGPKQPAAAEGDKADAPVAPK
jgi:molecular chaperone GrpE